MKEREHNFNDKVRSLMFQKPLTMPQRNALENGNVKFAMNFCKRKTRNRIYDYDSLITALTILRIMDY